MNVRAIHARTESPATTIINANKKLDSLKPTVKQVNEKKFGLFRLKTFILTWNTLGLFLYPISKNKMIALKWVLNICKHR